MQDRNLCWRPYFFLGPAVALTFLILEAPMFNRVVHSKSIFITTENHHAGETFMLPPLLFSLAPQCPPPSFFILESPLASSEKASQNLADCKFTKNEVRSEIIFSSI